MKRSSLIAFFIFAILIALSPACRRGFHLADWNLIRIFGKIK